MNKIIKKLLEPRENSRFIKRNFLINCVLLTLISSLLAIGSSRYLFKYELPEDNFVTLEIVASIEIDCVEIMLEGGLDTGDMLDCESGNYEIYRTRASGAVLKSSDSKSWLLTADHFCDIDSNMSSIPLELIPDIKIEKVIKKNGKNYNFEIIKQDADKDLCLISSETYLVDDVLIVASEMPEVGELTSTISSPLGISERGVSLHFSGTFSGCNLNACFFTIPAISGSSGSLVLNYDKEIVGMTQRSLIGFPEVTIGVGVYDITEFISEYERESGNEITHQKFFDRFSF